MQIDCPFCGARDIREFTYLGHETYIHRPADEAWSDAWNDYLHNRENPAGMTRDLWFHGSGCGAWLVVTRNTVTHEITGVELAREASRHAG
ncbi:sarcosine oxidase subunit delta [Roseibacterium sp. SDUM158016]|uniref:sarcosine oxidase subunit delta n=1 Tax=Roseicyclus sediminis TaxID=2980997 RepID=UPI0021D30421|nr:sarcosine oxidase subunit delta [Roseibacterium sp. SDUM158016]MCU4653188.1 sarcosine oxidase subunit delta [Roseibacterium sp. SDUM158016]